MIYSFSALNLLKSLMSLAPTTLICSRVPGRPLAPVPNCSRVLALSVVVDVTEVYQTVPFTA
jgi:hypothetical protein